MFRWMIFYLNRCLLLLICKLDLVLVFTEPWKPSLYHRQLLSEMWVAPSPAVHLQPFCLSAFGWSVGSPAAQAAHSGPLHDLDLQAKALQVELVFCSIFCSGLQRPIARESLRGDQAQY